jgi:hypothetical protein
VLGQPILRVPGRTRCAGAADASFAHWPLPIVIVDSLGPCN